MAMVVKIKDLPLIIEVEAEDKTRKAYQLVRAGQHGACLNKAPKN